MKNNTAILRLLFILISLGGVTVSNAQKQGQPLVDSLLLELPKHQQDKTRAEILGKLGYALANINPDEGKRYAKEALSLSEKLGCNDCIASARSAVGKNQSATGEVAKALESYKKGIAKTTNKKIMGLMFKDISLAYYNLSDYTHAMDYGMRCLKMAEEQDDKKLEGAVLSNIGLVYFDLGKYDKAIDFYEKALKINTEIGNKVNMSRNLGNLGSTYMITGNPAKSIGYYLRAVEINREFGDKLNLALNIGAIGNSYFKLNDYPKALKYSEESMAMTQELGIDELISFNHALIGDIYFQMAKAEKGTMQQQLLAKGEYHFEKALEIHKKTNARKDIMYDYQNLYEIEKMTGDYGSALKSHEMMLVYKDSIFNADNKETIKNLEDKRSIELRDKQIQLNKVTLEAAARQKWFYILGIFGLILILGLIFWQSRNRKKTNQKLQVLNTELDEANKVKARFLGIINHDLKSPVSSLISFLHIQKESPEALDEKMRQEMQDKTITSAENLLESMEDILLWSKGQMDHFKPEFKDVNMDWLFDDLRKHFSHVNHVKFSFENPENAALFTDENYLKTILRNLVANAVKALNNTADATVIVKMSPSQLSVSDNGPGGNSEQFRALHDDSAVSGMQSGMGLHLIRDMAKAINCNISVDSKPGKGTTFKITFL